MSKPHTNGFKLGDPNVVVLAHVSQFTALKLGLEFQFWHKIWCILVGKPFLRSICGVAILVVVAAAAAAADQLEGYLAISHAYIDGEHEFFKSLLFFSQVFCLTFLSAFLRLNFSESIGIGIVSSRISQKPLCLQGI